MRRSNWKSKLVVVIAVVIGILCGLAAAYVVNQKFGAAYIGLAFFITMPLVAGILMFLMIRVFILESSRGKNDETKQDAE